MDQFVPKVKGLLMEKNHGVLITGVALMIEMCKLDASVVDGFRKFVPHLVRIFSSLLQYGFSPEYDVGGVTDPFLQVKILRLLRMLGEGDAETSDQMNVVLAGVATNTDNVRNVGNSILYECVNTIMGIDSEAGLRVLAINTLAKFLAHRDNNIRYVALNTLCTVVNIDMEAVQRHRNTIVDCLKDNDISIRRRALELVYSLVNSSNVRVLVRELINFLQIADIEFRPDLTARLCLVAEKYAPTPRWHIDTILRVMSIAGDHVPDATSNTLLALIAQTPDIQSYAVQKMYLALTTDITQQTLVKAAVWCIGEFGDLLTASGANASAGTKNLSSSSPAPSAANDLLSDLIGFSAPATTQTPPTSPTGNAAQTPVSSTSSTTDTDEESTPSLRVTEAELIDLFRQILSNIATKTSTKRQVLTALLKLTTRLPGATADLKALIAQYETHINVELQQRAVEYEKILELPQLPSQLLMRIPAPEVKAMIAATTEELNAKSNTRNNARSAPATMSGNVATSSAGSNASGAAMDILSMDLLNLTPTANVSAPVNGQTDLLAMLSAAPLVATGATGSSQGTGMIDLMGGSSMLQPMNVGGSAPLMPVATGANLLQPQQAPIDLLASLPSSSASLSPSAQTSWPTLGVVRNASDGIAVTFDISKPQPASPQFTLVNVTFSNSGAQPITDVELKLSLPKYLKMQLLPISSTSLAPFGGSATQQIKLANTAQGQKGLLMRLRLEYKINGEAKAELAEPQIPENI